MPDRFFGGVAKDTLGTDVPRLDDAIQRLADDRVIRGHDDRGQACALQCGVLIDRVLDERAHRSRCQSVRVGDRRRGDAGPKRRTVMAVDNNRDIANGLAGTNRLRGRAALHIRRGGRAAPQVNRPLIEPDDATVAIGDADRHGQGIEGLRVERIDGEVGIHNLTFLRST